MHAPIFTLSALAVMISRAAAQTPSGYQPGTGNNLVEIYGTTTVSAGQSFSSPRKIAEFFLTTGKTADNIIEVSSVPTLMPGESLGSDPQGTFMVFMIDRLTNLDGTDIPVLQWWQPDYQVEDGVFNVVNTTAPHATYYPPEPIPGKPHQYITLLYNQPDGFVLPACYESILPESGREGFDIEMFAENTGIGEPLEAIWFSVQNPTPPTASYAVTSTYISTATCMASTSAAASSTYERRGRAAVTPRPFVA